MSKQRTPVEYKDGKLYKDGKPVTRRNRSYKLWIVQYVSGQIAQGKSLEKVLPVVSSTALPDLLEFMQFVNSSEECKRLYNEGRLARYTLLSERLVSAVQQYDKNPTKDNAEILKAIAEARKYLEKGGVDQDNITIEVTSMVPKGFWDKSDWRVKGNKNEEQSN